MWQNRRFFLLSDSWHAFQVNENYKHEKRMLKCPHICYFSRRLPPLSFQVEFCCCKRRSHDRGAVHDTREEEVPNAFDRILGRRS